MPRGPLASFHSVLVGSVLCALSGVAACSLLAPSDEEAMAGLGSKADGAVLTEAAAGDTGVSADGATNEGGSPACAQCQGACNNGQCSACFLNGGPCTSNAQCCGGVCNPQKTCGPMAGACTPDNEDCTTPDSCCAGETCSVDRNSRCAACRSLGGNCKADTDCCSTRCSASGSCTACMPKGTPGCTRPRECCSGVCNAGTCG